MEPDIISSLFFGMKISTQDCHLRLILDNLGVTGFDSETVKFIEI